MARYIFAKLNADQRRNTLKYAYACFCMWLFWQSSFNSLNLILFGRKYELLLCIAGYLILLKSYAITWTFLYWKVSAQPAVPPRDLDLSRFANGCTVSQYAGMTLDVVIVVASRTSYFVPLKLPDSILDLRLVGRNELLLEYLLVPPDSQSCGRSSQDWNRDATRRGILCLPVVGSILRRPIWPRRSVRNRTGEWRSPASDVITRLFRSVLWQLRPWKWGKSIPELVSTEHNPK